MPMNCFSPRASCIAVRSGTKPCSAITRCTRSRVMGSTLVLLFSTRETVDFETPARRAISRMVGFITRELPHLDHTRTINGTEALPLYCELLSVNHRLTSGPGRRPGPLTWRYSDEQEMLSFS